MPQSKEVHREYMRKRRGSQPGSQYPVILEALVNPEKRKKLEKIHQSLKEFNQLENVYYGYPDRGIPFDMVGELLEATC